MGACGEEDLEEQIDRGEEQPDHGEEQAALVDIKLLDQKAINAKLTANPGEDPAMDEMVNFEEDLVVEVGPFAAITTAIGIMTQKARLPHLNINGMTNLVVKFMKMMMRLPKVEGVRKIEMQ